MGFRKAGLIQRKPARDSRAAVMRPAAPESPLCPPVAHYSNRAGGRIVQAKLAVALSGSSYEQDADRAADQWLRESKRPIRVQTIMASTWKDGIAMPPEANRRIDWLRGQGAPLPPALRRQFESRMQRSLVSVRIHTGAEAAELAAMLEARAFATGNDVFFASGEWQPHTPSGQRLLAHELAHTVQQTQSVTGPGVQRAEKGVLQSIKETAAGVVSEGAALAGQAAMALVRRFAPGLAKIIDQGPFEYIRSKITSALQDWLPSLFQGFGIDAILAKARTGISGILAKLDDLRHPSLEACKNFANTLGTIRDFITDLIDNPVIEFLRTGIAEFQTTMSKVAAFVVAPIFDFLRDQAVSTWNTIKTVASWIWSGIKAVKDFAGDAVDFVLKQLGIDLGESSGEEGVWGWFKRKANQAWNAIKEALAPVVAPIKTAVTIALALSPLGPLYVVIRYGPQVVKSIQWLWEHRDDPDIVKKAHAEMGNTILPGILDAVTNADIKLKEGIDWLTGKFEEIATAVLDFVGKLTGLPLLGAVQSLAAKASDALKETVAWGRDTLQKGAEFFRKIVADISKKIEPYKKVLSSLALALVNPPMIPVILAGWAWKAVPKCFKIPIIDFILDIVITALTKAPDLPFMGPLWPLLKSAVVAALETFRKQDDDTKEKLSNKIAEIISGASPDFLIGFVKGFLTGVWETLTDPIKAIWSIIEGLNKLLELFDKWTGDGETQMVQAVPKANTAAAGTSASAAAAAPKAVAAPPVTSPASSVPDHAAAVAQSAEPGAAAGGQEAESVPPADVVQLTPQDETSLGERLGQMGKELQPPAKTVTSQFWDAAQQYFSADGGSSFPQLVAKLGEAWEAVKNKIQQESSELTKKLIAYLLSGTADGEIGDKLGWLTGMVVTQLVLDYLTAGTTEVLKPLQAIAKFLNWPMELMGKAFKLIGKLGKYVVSWIKKMGGMVKDAAAGAFLAVKDALGVIGSKLVEFAEEIIARFSKFGKKGAGAAVKEGEHLGEAGLAKAAGQEGKALGKAEQKAAQKGEGVVADSEATAQKDAKKAAEKAKEQTSKEIEEAAEVGPSAVAGHEIKFTESGMLVRCSKKCELLSQRYAIVLEANPELKEALASLAKKSKQMTKSQLKMEANKLEKEILDTAVRDAIRATGRDIKDIKGAMAAIKKNPEQLEKLFDIQASRTKEALKATGEEMLDVASHTTGVSAELRKPLRAGATTPELRTGVNVGFTPGIKDPALPGKFINKPLEADHLFSLKRMIQEAGFGELTYEEMLYIARYKGNFAGLSKSANASKGAKSFAEWLEHKRSGIKVDPAFRREMFLKEVQAENEILELIEKIKEYGI